MLECRAVTHDSLSVLLALRVTEAQRGLVAENAVTLAQAPHEPGSRVWGLWAGETAVGLMAMINPTECPFLEPDEDPGAAYLWRLMIDAGQQGKGYGREALSLAGRQARQWGLPRLTAGVVDRVDSSIGFYEACGFRRNGRLVEGEIEIVLAIRDRDTITRS